MRTEMNEQQLESLLRMILQFAGGFVVAKGWVDEKTMLGVVGALVTICVTAWGLWRHSDVEIVKSAAKLPVVREIITAENSESLMGHKKIRVEL